MVTILARPLPADKRDLMTAVRQGLESLTVTGPSPMLEAIYREALEAAAHRPSRQERERAITQAWQASSRVVQPLPTTDQPAVAKAVYELYSLTRLAISASCPALE